MNPRDETRWGGCSATPRGLHDHDDRRNRRPLRLDDRPWPPFAASIAGSSLSFPSDRVPSRPSSALLISCGGIRPSVTWDVSAVRNLYAWSRRRKRHRRDDEDGAFSDACLDWEGRRAMMLRAGGGSSPSGWTIEGVEVSFAGFRLVQLTTMGVMRLLLDTEQRKVEPDAGGGVAMARSSSKTDQRLIVAVGVVGGIAIMVCLPFLLTPSM